MTTSFDEIVKIIALFFCGGSLCNCIPHLVAGLQGSRFPTPFARPRGAGTSSAQVNFIWGAANLLAGLSILARRPMQLGANLECVSLAAGALLLGATLSRRFATARAQRQDLLPADPFIAQSNRDRE